MGHFDRLPVLNEQPRRACPKPSARVDVRAADDRDAAKREKAYRLAVRQRDFADGQHCRACRRHVVVVLEFRADRAEVHHLYGRGKAFRYEVRAGITLCASCHEQCTGKKLLPVGKLADAFTLNGKRYIDATHEVRFYRAP